LISGFNFHQWLVPEFWHMTVPSVNKSIVPAPNEGWWARGLQVPGMIFSFLSVSGSS